MNTETSVNPTQAPDSMTTTSPPAPEVLQVTTSPTPENGVVLGSTTIGGEATANQADHGVGIEGEEIVWAGRYSYKNFTFRIILRVAATVGWLFLLAYIANRTPSGERWDRNAFAWITGGVVLLYWLLLAWQMVVARLGHRYELTNRRLFVDTGVFRHRRDQMELLKVEDVYVKQPTLFTRMLDIGTVVVESSEERLPIHYLAGVDAPRPLMDLIWHQARKERDLKSVKVDHV